MKIDFANLNIEPSPNPKPLTTQKVMVTVSSEDGKRGPVETGFIRNTNLHPEAIARWRW